MRKSLIFLTLASIGYAAMVIPTKLLTEVHSLFLVWSGFLFTGLFGLIMSYKKGFRYSSMSMDAKKYVIIFGIAHSVCSFCLNYSVKLLNASTALLLLYSAPLWIFLYLSIIKKHKIKLLEIFILGLAMIGMYLVINGDSSISIDGSWLGLILALTAGILYSVDFLMGEKRPKGLSSLTATALIHLIGAIVLLPGVFYFPTGLDTQGWLLVLSFDLILLGSFLCFLKGVKNLNSLYASIITLMEPVFAAIMAYLWLNEKMSSTSIIGAVILLAAIFFVDKLVAKLQTENNS
jgi:drug/metabolite transporter (DMT)-like permease